MGIFILFKFTMKAKEREMKISTQQGLGLRVLLIIININTTYSAYAHAPEINRKGIAGIWRLTNEKSVLPQSLLGSSEITFPMKEFTVYPKKKDKMLKKTEKPDNNVLLLLNEDGSFTQYEGLQLTKESNRQKYEEKLTKSKSKNVNSVAGLAFLKGTWDYLDGKLILATDRPEDVDPKKVHDTILSGKVLLSPSASSKSSKEEVDMNLLSVPKGSIKVGKFMYPKRHRKIMH